ncbi:unnamed protein product [Rotaria sordida]|uniref:Uncharacterized protein n=1 Tax=Rotaria sordida TaxID=392033 RepID=A0A815FEA9_9BILA|nr:unnamed protein product [Rotaria sordida]CAF1323983.1 unnamed protein product [Rotaria sordida]CAF1439307.1 unnamed protein product [Rotaria sordida]
MYPNMNINRNHSWENWGSHGYILGSFLIIIGIIIQILEYPRIFNGPTNINDNLYTITNYYNHWWPWTYAASIFGLFTLLTGIIGILAGIRRSYGSILSFFIMCLFSTLFAVYLIVYFSFIIKFYQIMIAKSKSGQRTNTESISYGLASAQLTMACINVLISFIATIFTGRSIAICLPKGVLYDDVQPMSRPMPYQTYTNRFGF